MNTEFSQLNKENLKWMYDLAKRSQAVRKDIRTDKDLLAAYEKQDILLLLFVNDIQACDCTDIPEEFQNVSEEFKKMVEYGYHKAQMECYNILNGHGDRYKELIAEFEKENENQIPEED